jgi:hypothetical protein
VNRRDFLAMMGAALAAEPLEQVHRVYSFPSKIKIVKSLDDEEIGRLLDAYYRDREAVDFAYKYYYQRLRINLPGPWSENASKIGLGMLAEQRRREDQLAEEIWTYGHSNRNPA